MMQLTFVDGWNVTVVVVVVVTVLGGGETRYYDGCPWKWKE
jgi:hypothetical protein